MPAPKTPAKAAASKGAAARAEAEDAPKVVEFDGLKLEVPKELPAATLFDMVESEASTGDANEYIVNLRILRSIVGRDQFIEVRHKLGDTPEQVLELMGVLLEQYGLTMGESAASPDS